MANQSVIEVKMNKSYSKENQCDCSKSFGFYSVVLWCCCAMGILTGTYSLYRQQFIEDRLTILEEQQKSMRMANFESSHSWKGSLEQDLELKSSRSLLRRPRNADCICPQG